MSLMFQYILHIMFLNFVNNNLFYYYLPFDKETIFGFIPVKI